MSEMLTESTPTRRKESPKKARRTTKLDQLKLPPHSVEAEKSVLGGLMLDNQAWDRLVGRVNVADFYRQDHRLIFIALSELANKNQPFDVITIAENLKAQGELENAGGELNLFDLAKNTPTTANIVAYADIVRERSVLRQLLATTHEIAESAYHPEGRDSQTLLNEAETKIFKIAEQVEQGDGPVDLSTLLAQATEKIDTLYHSDQTITGLATGFSDLDDMTSGLQKGELIIIAGRPSMGKTVFVMNVATHAAIQGDLPILVFSLEMPGDALAMRMMSALGRVDQHKVRSGKLADDDWPRITSAISMLSNAQMFIDDTPGLSPAEMRGRARRVARAQGQLGLIVIDYLQLMQLPGKQENRNVEVSEISRALKALAKEMKCPVLCAAQLNRSLEQRADKRPVMSDLRESGAIEQDADVIGFIYRDEVYNENTPDKGVAEILIAKHRNGPIGKFKLAFMGQYTLFENYTPNNYPAEVS